MVRMEYRPGAENIDLDSTFENIIGKKYPSYSDIIVLDRGRDNRGAVLMLDTSKSMGGEKLAIAAVTGATVAYNFKINQYAIITFEDEAHVLKSLNNEKKIVRVVGEILETSASGCTNIEDALRRGLSEVNLLRVPKRRGILITDGFYTRGHDPRPVAREFPRLDVVYVPGGECSEKMCVNLAKLGSGKIVKVETYEKIPGAVIDLVK